jgi:Ca-activated chloride channel family protein
MTHQHPKVEFFTTKEKLAAEREQTVDVLIRITPPEALMDKITRPRLNLSIVLDRSGSMSGEKMVRAREAAMYCVDQMLSTDRLSVITFDEHIAVLFPSKQVENKESMKSLISRIEARGSTALHEAWVRGGLTVCSPLLETGINRVLLITDGQANVGITNPDQIVTEAMELFKRGVSTSTIGIGDDFNEDLLMPMAESAGGNAWHVVEPNDMHRIFQSELEGLVTQFGHRVSLGLIPADGVRIADALNDFALTDTGRYQLPNLQAGSPLDIVVQLRVGPQAAGSVLRLLDLRLGFTPQGEESAEVFKATHSVEFVDSLALEGLPENYEVAKAVQFLMNARARREAIRHLDLGDVDSARKVVFGSLSNTRAALAAVASSAPVLEELASLEEMASSLTDRVREKLNRKKLAYAAYSRRTSK